MKIFEENGRIRLQLARLQPHFEMLFDFTIAKEEFNEFKEHVIKALKKSKIGLIFKEE